jgi:uncharacterized membrane protein (UPF0127 family)
MQSRLARTALLAAAAISAAALAGCSQTLQKVQLTVGDHRITVEVARTESQRERGLMGRTHLGPEEGMIFVFDRDEHLEFWMKDTPLPLSIAFLSAEGKILEIRDMQPFDERTIRSRFSARYALELNQGAFHEMGIAEGDTVTFPAGFTQ